MPSYLCYSISYYFRGIGCLGMYGVLKGGAACALTVGSAGYDRSLSSCCALLPRGGACIGLSIPSTSGQDPANGLGPLPALFGVEQSKGLVNSRILVVDLDICPFISLSIAFIMRDPWPESFPSPEVSIDSTCVVSACSSF